jgi:hypothetical protein
VQLHLQRRIQAPPPFARLNRGEGEMGGKEHLIVANNLFVNALTFAKNDPNDNVPEHQF